MKIYICRTKAGDRLEMSTDPEIESHGFVRNYCLISNPFDVKWEIFNDIKPGQVRSFSLHKLPKRKGGIDAKT